MLAGKRVEWEKVNGKRIDCMFERNGFGTLDGEPKVGQRMTILGDYGVITTEAISADYKDGVLIVVTKNCTYYVTQDCMY